MALALDPTYFPAIAHWIPLLQSRPVPKLHEHLVIRSNVDALFGEASKRLGYPEDVVQDVLKFKSFDGEEIEIMWTRIKSPSEAESSSAQPAIVHAHGGGMIAGVSSYFRTHLHREWKLDWSDAPYAQQNPNIVSFQFMLPCAPLLDLLSRTLG